MTGNSLHWRTIEGEWHFSESAARQTSSDGLARAQARFPSGDFVYSVRVTPADEKRACAGITFRGDARGASRYELRAHQPGLYNLEKVLPKGRHGLGGWLRLPVDRSCTMTVVVTGVRLRCYLDGRKVYDVVDQEPLRGRHAGLISIDAASDFDEISIEPITARNLGPHLQALARHGLARKEKEYGIRHRVIDMKGRGGYISVGDLDGDGRPDFVTTQGTRYLTAVTQDGEVLWSYDNPKGVIRSHPECQMPTTIYDIDGDGANEVICRWYRGDQELIYILDGRTGAIKREMRWEHPTWPDPGEGEVGHVIIANLRGLEQPRDFLVTTGHHGIFAFTDKMEQLWGHDREEFKYLGGPFHFLSHHPCPADLDGDGCDEVCTGGILLDQDGSVLWTLDLVKELGEKHHVDSVMIGDVDGDPSNGLEIAFSTGGSLLNARGEFLWKQRGLVLHGQMVRLGKTHSDVPGLQMLVLDCSSRSPGTYLFSATGEVLLKLSLGLISFIDWNGDGLDEIACGPVLYEAAGSVLAQIPIEEVHRAHGFEYPKPSGDHFIIADVTGDAREEVIWSSVDLIAIFENAAPNPHPPLRLTPAQQQARWKKIYNFTRY